MMAQVDSLASMADLAAQGQGEENKFQKAIAAWRNIDLTSIMPSIDNAASDLVAHQRDSLVQRKDLAQKTKDFRKLDDSSKLSEFKTILKAYQTYIDVISNQTKATHSAFLQLYTPIADAPDPYPLLEASIDSLVTAEEVLPKVQEENEQLRRQISKLTTELDATEKRLSEERDTRKTIEAEQETRIKAVEKSWSDVLKEKQENWEAKERNFEEKIEHQDRLIKEIKASQEVSARMSKDDTGSGNNITSAELDVVHSELDRANTRLAEVEARNEELRLQVAHSASDVVPKSRVEDDQSFQRLQLENSSLMRKLESQRLEKDSDKRGWTERTRSLERELATLQRDRDAMRRKIGQWKDYENIKQELEVLKSIEFATGDDDEQESEQSPAGRTNGRETLEQLLLSRNKKLSSELTLLRVSHHDLQGRLEVLQEEASKANMELERSRALCATLENDLEQVQQEAANNFPSSAMSVAGTYTSRYPSKSLRGAPRSSSPTSSIISGFDNSFSQTGGTLDSLRQSDAGAGAGSNSSILPMITAQRDRFKKKNATLEAELQKSYQSIQSLRSEVAALQKDNLSLYEKTRYVSSYGRSNPPSQSTTIQIDNGNVTSPGSTTNTMASSDVGRRYHAAYESSLTPFSAFRSRESARAFSRMPLPERAVVQITRLVLATRTSRNLFAAYCAALHVLVLFVLLHNGEHAGARRTVSLVGGATAYGSTGKIAGSGAVAAAAPA